MMIIGSDTVPPFLSDISGKRVVIVGNGPSAVGDDLGDRIDGFDIIVRINNYVIGDLDSQVGARTDVWVNGANQGLKKRSVPPNNILVMIPPVVLKEKGSAIHERIRKRLGTDHYFLVPLSDMEAMEAFSGIDRPTTGLFSILYFYLAGAAVALHGFDFFVGSKSHYFDGTVKRWLKEKGIIRKAGKHAVTAEKQLVEKLMKEGGLQRLEP